MSDETIEKTFQVTSPARLVISNIRGSITIQPGEVDVIEVRAFKHGNVEGKKVVEMTQDADGSVRVETRSNGALFGFVSHPPRVDYSVRVPQGVHLDASGVSSTLNVTGLEGSFKLKTISGDMTLTDLSGPFKVSAVSGDITGTNLAGLLELGTVSGGVNLLMSSFPAADTSTVSGDMVLQTPIAGGPYMFSSVSGSVRLLVPADTNCNVELNSVSGKIRSSLPVTSLAMGHGVKVTRVQNGGTAVRLKSVSGGLTLETEGVPATAVPVTPSAPETPVPATAWVPTPPIPPVSPVQPEPAPLSTAEILQRIESGELSVDEAIKLMKDQP